MAVIYLIRHGQASFLQNDYDKLSDLGITQSKVLGESLKSRNREVSVVTRGSLVRHQETAENCLESFGQSMDHTIDERWNEYDHMELLAKHNPDFSSYEAIGAYLMKQDHPMKALQQLLNVSIMDWMSKKNDYTISWENFKKNISKALHQTGDQLGKGQTAWIFTSGGPISVALIELLSLKDEQFVQLQGRLVNSSVTKILVGKGGLSLSTYNEYSHLEHSSELITYR